MAFLRFDVCVLTTHLKIVRETIIPVGAGSSKITNVAALLPKEQGNFVLLPEQNLLSETLELMNS